MPELQLIGGPASNFVWTCRIACAEKGVPYSLVPVMPHAPEVNAIHPLGKIPALRHGEVSLCESRAICLYIDRAFDGPPLTSADPAAAAHIEQWISLVMTAVDPLFARQYVAAYFFPGTPDGSPNRTVIDAALPKMAPMFGLLDRTVGATGHLAGHSFTLADMYLLPLLYYMDKMPESGALLRQTAHLAAYFDHHLARRSVAESTPPALPRGATSRRP